MSGRLATLLGSDNFRWVVTVLAIPLTVFFWNQLEQRRTADAQKAAADQAKAQRNADLIIKLLPALAKPLTDPERINAMAVVDALDREGGLDPVLRDALKRSVDQIAQSPDSAARVKALEVVARDMPNSADYADGAASAPGWRAQLPGARIYLQIYDEAKRPLAERLRSAAREAGVAAPGVENVVASARRAQRAEPKPWATEASLLYFREADAELARNLARTLTPLLDSAPRVEARRGAAFDKVPAGQLELWLP